jgi:amidase
VPATLSLTLGAPASFGAFVPGAPTKEYTAASTATVISTAGDAALSVSEPGHLANGSFTLPEPLRVELGKTAWTGPISGDTVGITFKQLIKANDPLRTGVYSKTLTFTLSTTQP